MINEINLDDTTLQIDGHSSFLKDLAVQYKSIYLLQFDISRVILFFIGLNTARVLLLRG